MKMPKKPLKPRLPREPLKPRLPREPQKTITLFEEVELGTINLGNTTLGDIKRQIKHLFEQQQLSNDSTIFLVHMNHNTNMNMNHSVE